MGYLSTLYKKKTIYGMNTRCWLILYDALRWQLCLDGDWSMAEAVRVIAPSLTCYISLSVMNFFCKNLPLGLSRWGVFFWWKTKISFISNKCSFHGFLLHAGRACKLLNLLHIERNIICTKSLGRGATTPQPTLLDFWTALIYLFIYFNTPDGSIQ